MKKTLRYTKKSRKGRKSRNILKTRRHKKGGNLHAEFEERKIRLQTTIQRILDAVIIPHSPHIERFMRHAVEEVRNNTITALENNLGHFRNEANEIDNYFNNNDMEELIDSSIGLIIFEFDDLLRRIDIAQRRIDIAQRINNNAQNINNNATTIVSSSERISNSNSNSKNYNSLD
jgi:hypothetical protein